MNRMYKIQKSFHVSVGHRLSKHKGLCQNVHGHNLKILVVLRASELDENDMVLDFSVLKEIMEPILATLDHATLFNETDHDNIEYAKKMGYKTHSLSCSNVDPTAEVIAEAIFSSVTQSLIASGHNLRVTVDSVRVWENDTAMAEYMRYWR